MGFKRNKRGTKRNDRNRSKTKAAWPGALIKGEKIMKKS